MTLEQRNSSIISTNFACIHSSNLSLTSRITNTTRLVRSHFEHWHLDYNTSFFSDSDLILAREKTNLYLSLCDLLSTFVWQHSFRSHFFMLSSSISSHVATLLFSKDKHLRLGWWPSYRSVVSTLLITLPRLLAALRFFRIHLKNNNRNFLSHLTKLEVFKPIVELTVKESRRDTLVNSSCQEFFEFMRRVCRLYCSLLHTCSSQCRRISRMLLLILCLTMKSE